MKRFVVVGLGNFGSAVAEALHHAGHDVITVDMDEDAVDRIADRVTRAAVGDGRSIEVLRRVGADHADAGIVSTGDDITASILATLALRDLGVSELYVKVISLEHARVLEQMGVTETIFPERESGLRLATRVANRMILNFVPIGPGFGIQEIAVPDPWIGKSLRDLALPRKYRVTILAIHDMLQDEIEPVPDPDMPIKESDTILMFGRDEDLARLTKLK